MKEIWWGVGVCLVLVCWPWGPTGVGMRVGVHEGSCSGQDKLCHISTSPTCRCAVLNHSSSQQNVARVQSSPTRQGFYLLQLPYTLRAGHRQLADVTISNTPSNNDVILAVKLHSEEAVRQYVVSMVAYDVSARRLGFQSYFKVTLLSPSTAQVWLNMTCGCDNVLMSLIDVTVTARPSPDDRCHFAQSTRTLHVPNGAQKIPSVVRVDYQPGNTMSAEGSHFSLKPSVSAEWQWFVVTDPSQPCCRACINQTDEQYEFVVPQRETECQVYFLRIKYFTLQGGFIHLVYYMIPATHNTTSPSGPSTHQHTSSPSSSPLPTREEDKIYPSTPTLVPSLSPPATTPTAVTPSPQTTTRKPSLPPRTNHAILSSSRLTSHVSSPQTVTTTTTTTTTIPSPTLSSVLAVTSLSSTRTVRDSSPARHRTHHPTSQSSAASQISHRQSSSADVKGSVHSQPVTTSFTTTTEESSGVPDGPLMEVQVFMAVLGTVLGVLMISGVGVVLWCIRRRQEKQKPWQGVADILPSLSSGQDPDLSMDAGNVVTTPPPLPHAPFPRCQNNHASRTSADCADSFKPYLNSSFDNSDQSSSGSFSFVSSMSLEDMDDNSAPKDLDAHSCQSQVTSFMDDGMCASSTVSFNSKPRLVLVHCENDSHPAHHLRLWLQKQAGEMVEISNIIIPDSEGLRWLRHKCCEEAKVWVLVLLSQTVREILDDTSRGNEWKSFLCGDGKEHSLNSSFMSIVLTQDAINPEDKSYFFTIFSRDKMFEVSDWPCEDLHRLLEQLQEQDFCPPSAASSDVTSFHIQKCFQHINAVNEDWEV